MDKREKHFADKFNKANLGFKYVGGYINADSYMFIECKRCGQVLKRSGSFLRRVMRGDKNISCDQCKMYTQRKNRGMFAGKTEEEFKHEFEQKFEQFEYYDKYTNTDNPFLMQCKECGHIQERNAQCLRRNKSIRCDGCTAIRITAKEMERKKEAEERKQAREEKRRLAEIERNKPHSLICKNCGESFESKRKKMYCSDKCLRKHMNREKENRKRMKELILKDSNLYDSSISLDKLIVRDKNICHICGRECDINDYEQRDDNTFIAGGNYPSIDHVIPLNKGGTHTWANVSLAHMWCNTIKSDKLTGTNMEHLELQDTLQENDRRLA